MTRLEAIDCIYKTMTSYYNNTKGLEKYSNLIPHTDGTYFKGLILGMCTAYLKANMIKVTDYKKIKEDMHTIMKEAGWE